MGHGGSMCATKRRQPLAPNKVVRAMEVVTKLAISALRIRICELIQWKSICVFSIMLNMIIITRLYKYIH